MEAAVRKTRALIGKDLKDIVKNPTMLVCCLMPIGFVLLYQQGFAGKAEGAEAQTAIVSMLLSMALLFTATMVASMATLTAIAEEKEKNTLRTLMLANVGSEQILVSRGLVTLLAIAIVEAVCYFIIGSPLSDLAAYLVIGVLGAVPIVLISLLLGLASRDQMSAGLLSVPIMLIGIGPMLGTMIDGFSDYIVYLPTGGMYELGDLLAQGQLLTSEAVLPAVATLVWIAVATAAFVLVYKRLARDN